MWLGGRPIGNGRCILRVESRSDWREAGLYLVRRGEKAGEPRLLVADRLDRSWIGVAAWKQRGATVEVVLEALEGQMYESAVHTYWRAEVTEAGVEGLVRVASFEQEVAWSAVSPDLDWLAVVAEQCNSDANRVLLVPLTDAVATITTLLLPDSVQGVAFHPEDGRLLAWAPPTSPASEGEPQLFVGHPASLIVQEDEEDEWDFGIINGPRPREIPLPARVTGITEAAWLTGDRVLLSVPEQGLLKFNVATGELAPVWELPEGDLPCRPEVRLLPLPDTFSDEGPEKDGRGPD